MDVRRVREVVLADLDHRTKHHDVPVWPRLSYAGDEFKVHALVDYAAVAEARMRDIPLVGRLLGPLRAKLARLSKMFGVDAAGETVDGGMTVALGFEKALAAGEDQVGRNEQLSFCVTQTGRRSAEGGKFVHAVVDSHGRRELPRKVQRQRRVIPEDDVFELLFCDELPQQLFLRSVRFRLGKAFRQLGDYDLDLVLTRG